MLSWRMMPDDSPVTSSFLKAGAFSGLGLARMAVILSAVTSACILYFLLVPRVPRFVAGYLWYILLAGVIVTALTLSAKQAWAFRRRERQPIVDANGFQESSRLQKALLNSISHSLRTPIASVMGALSTVLEEEGKLDASTQRRLLETAQDEVARLNRLIQNLLDVSRLEGGAIQLKRTPCDVNDVVGAALEQLGEAARKRAVSINIPPGLPLVPMDHVLIVQVLANLVDNSLNYSPPEMPVEITARLHQGDLEIRVGDSGSGIEEQDLERVFEKFFRGVSPGGPHGLGLGLSICKGFVSAHGGRIWARGREQGGTEVAFFLPVEV